MKCVPAFTLSASENHLSLDALLDKDDSFFSVNARSSIRIIGDAVTITQLQKSDQLAQSIGMLGLLREEFHWRVVGLLRGLGRYFSTRSVMNVWLSHVLSRAFTSIPLRSDRAQMFLPGGATPASSWETEIIVPRQQFRSALQAIRNILTPISSDHSAPLFVTYITFVESDLDLMSPFYSENLADSFVCLRVVSWDAKLDDINPVFKRLQDALSSLGGRPHWGYAHQFSASELVSQRPPDNLIRFWSVASRLDRDGMFLNSFLHSLKAAVDTGSTGESSAARDT